MKLEKWAIKKIAKTFPQPYGRVKRVLRLSPSYDIAMLLLKWEAMGLINAENLIDIIDAEIIIQDKNSLRSTINTS